MTPPRDADRATSDDDFDLGQGALGRVIAAVDGGDQAALDRLLEPMHAADIADLIEQFTPARRRSFLTLYSGEIDGEILSEIDESIRDEVVDQLPHAVLAEAVREMESDDVVDLLEELEEP